MNSPKLINSINSINKISEHIDSWYKSNENCLLKVYGKKQIGKTRVINESLKRFGHIRSYHFNIRNGHNISMNELLYMVYEETNDTFTSKLLYFILDNLLIILLELAILILTNLFRLGIIIPSAIIISSLIIDFLLKKFRRSSLKTSKIVERIVRKLNNKAIFYFNRTKFLDDSCKNTIEKLLHLSSGKLMIILEFDVEDEESINRFNFSSFYNVHSTEIEILKLSDYKKFLKNNRHLDLYSLSDNDIELLYKNSNANLLFALNINSEKEIYLKKFYDSITSNELYILCSIVYYGNSISVSYLENILYKNSINNLFTHASFIQAFSSLSKKKIIYLESGKAIVNNFVYDLVIKNEISQKSYIAYTSFRDFLNSIEDKMDSNNFNSFELLRLLKNGIKYITHYELEDYIDIYYDLTKRIYSNFDFMNRIDFISYANSQSVFDIIMHKKLKKFLIEESINLSEYALAINLYSNSNNNIVFSDTVAHLLSLSMTGHYSDFEMNLKRAYKLYNQEKEEYFLDLLNLINEIEHKSSKIESTMTRIILNKSISMPIYAISLRCYSNVVFGEESLKLLEETISIFKKYNMKIEEGITYIALARKLMYMGEYKKSNEYLKKSKRLTIKTSIKDYHYYNNLAVNHMQMEISLKLALEN